MLDMTADIIDMRDVFDRVRKLRDLREMGPVDWPEGDEDAEAGQDDLFAELAALESLLSELAGEGGDEQFEGEWYPLMLIRDSYFEDYARELAEDIGVIGRNASWPNNCIDWEKAARELQMDYSSVEVGGVTYWYC